MRFTLIVVRRVTAPKTAGTGVMVDASSPMLTRPLATSSERIEPSRIFCCLYLFVMVETQGDREAVVLDEDSAENSDR